MGLVVNVLRSTKFSSVGKDLFNQNMMYLLIMKLRSSLYSFLLQQDGINQMLN